MNALSLKPQRCERRLRVVRCSDSGSLVAGGGGTQAAAEREPEDCGQYRIVALVAIRVTLF